jgi:hypothetical protein
VDLLWIFSDKLVQNLTRIQRNESNISKKIKKMSNSTTIQPKEGSKRALRFKNQLED